MFLLENLLLLTNTTALFITALLLAGAAKDQTTADWLQSILLGMSLILVVPLTVLGYTGWLRLPFLLLILYGLLAILLISRKATLIRIGREARNRLKASYVIFCRKLASERVMLGTTGFILAGTALTILFSQPAIYDSLTYRLPRIALWLQESSIQHFDTIDERQNWMPVAPDLLMLWIKAHQHEGFWGIQFVQWAGGLLALLSLYSLGKQFGFSSPTTTTAGLLFLCMPNVFVQLMSSHTDLITAGFAMSGLAFLVRSLKSGSGSWQAGAAWALAFGSKGTLFYWVLGLPLLLVLLVRYYKPSAALLGKLATSFLLFSLVLVLPRHIENHLRYGNPLANQELVERHHPDLTIGQTAEKFYLNGLSYLIQLFDPQANPAVLAPAMTMLGKPLTALLPEDDRYLFDGDNRKNNWEALFSRSSPDADGLSTGFVIALAGLAGAIKLWTIKGSKVRAGPAKPLRYLTGSVILFFLYFVFQQNAHLYAYRYFILMAVSIALIAACLIEFTAPKSHKLATWGLVALPLIHLPYLWFSTNQVGFNNVFETDKNRNLTIYKGTRALLETPPGNQANEVSLQLPYNYPIAGFFASKKHTHMFPKNSSQPATSESAQILLVSDLPEIEEPVAGRSFIFKDGVDDFSCVVLTGHSSQSQARPFVYGLDRLVTPGGIHETFLLRRNGKKALELQYNNPSTQTHRLSWKNGDLQGSDDWDPGTTSTVTIPVTESEMLEITVSSYYPEKDHRGFPEESITWTLQGVLYPVGDSGH